VEYPKKNLAECPKKSPIELFNIPHSGVIKKKSWAEKMFPVSVDDQKYISRCMEKHGDDYLKIFRDIKLNNMQYTENQLRKIGTRFLLLNPNQRRVDIPEKVKHLVQNC